LTLEAKWLKPAGAIPEVVAKDPKSCLLAVTIELREQAVARAARILRECGATPAQLKVGIQLVLGKTRPAIADELGLKHSTVADLAKKLYQILDVRNATELGARIWLGESRSEVQRSELPRPPGFVASGVRKAHIASLFSPSYKSLSHP
jgi:DNA-binding CsgD family transcriptional regulator